MAEAKIKSIVILSQTFAPTAYNQAWIVKEKLIDPNKFAPISTFAPDYTQIITPEYNLTIVQNQMTLNIIDNKEEKEAINLIKSCLKLMPSLPYRAIGLNLTYFAPITDNMGNSMTKKLFFYPTDYHKQFDSSDARFGIYMSRDYNNTRLKLDIKPSMVTDTFVNKTEELILFTFNYHRDLKPEENGYDLLVGLIDQWDVFIKHSEGIMNTFSF